MGLIESKAASPKCGFCEMFFGFCSRGTHGLQGVIFDKRFNFDYLLRLKQSGAESIADRATTSNLIEKAESSIRYAVRSTLF